MRLSEAEGMIGRKVVYTPGDGLAVQRREEGVITSVNSRWVFVRYGADSGSKATAAENLEVIG